MTPRSVLEQHLSSHGLSPLDFADAARISYDFVRSLLDGAVPKDPKSLHIVGKRLKMSGQWPSLAAAGIMGVPVDQVGSSIQGRMWTYLIQRGLTVAGCATAHKTSQRVVQVALSRGIASARLVESGLLDAIGVGPDHPSRIGVQANVDRELGDLIQQGMETTKIGIVALAEKIGASTRTIGALQRGEVPRQISPIIAPNLAKILRLDLRRVASLLARRWRTQTNNQGSLKFLVARHLFEHGFTTDILARRCKLSVQTVVGVLGGRLPDDDVLEVLHKELRISDVEWDAAVKRQRQRQIAPSYSYAALKDSLIPLPDLIAQKADATGQNIYEWGLSHGFSRTFLNDIVRNGLIPRRDDACARLCRALDIDRTHLDAICRLTAETLPKRERAYDTILPVTGVQETFLRLVREQGMSVPNLSREANVSRRMIERVLRAGAAELSPDTQEKLRHFLGLSPSDWTRLLDPIDSIEDVDDDDEMRLLAAYRKLTSVDRLRLREIAGRMLGRQRLDTVVSPAWMPKTSQH